MSAAPVSEMGFKVPGFRPEPVIIPCAGGCGVMTRSNGQPAAKFPGTKCRGPGGFCYKCGKAAAEAEQEVSEDDEALMLERSRDALRAMVRERRRRERAQLELVARRSRPRKTVRPIHSNA